MEPPLLHAQLPPKHAPAPTVSAPRTEPPLLHAQLPPKPAPAPTESAPRTEPPLLHAQLPSHKPAPAPTVSAPRTEPPLLHAQLPSFKSQTALAPTESARTTVRLSNHATELLISEANQAIKKLKVY